jgi:hypothetical protein
MLVEIVCNSDTCRSTYDERYIAVISREHSVQDSTKEDLHNERNKRDRSHDQPLLLA